MESKRGLVRYVNVEVEYLEMRQLHRAAGWPTLWAMGVGAVISGAYYGWQFGLAAAGFWGLLIGTLLIAILYTCLVYSIAELSAALPHAGGFFSFARSGLGPTGGFLCGATDTIEYVLTPAVIVIAIGECCGRLYGFGQENALAFVGCWLIFYAFFVGINIWGVRLALQVGMLVTLIAIGVLLFFFASALTGGHFRLSALLEDPNPPSSVSVIADSSIGLHLDSRDVDTGAEATQKQQPAIPELTQRPEPEPPPPFAWTWLGVFASLPFAIWFFLAIEQLPLAAEETHDVVENMPKALLLGLATILFLSLGTLVLCTGVTGAARLARSEQPIVDGFVAMFGPGAFVRVLTALTLAGFVASFHATIYAYGRVLFSLSRAGYFPRWISRTSRFRTPHLALLLGAGVGLIAAALIYGFGSEGGVGAALLNMAVFGAVLSYVLVLVSFIRLRMLRPELLRPYRSPLGIPGAAVGIVLALASLLATFSIPENRPAVWGTFLFLVVALVYFLTYSRYRLVARAPEEEAALLALAERELAE